MGVAKGIPFLGCARVEGKRNWIGLLFRWCPFVTFHLSFLHFLTLLSLPFLSFTEVPFSITPL